VLSFGYELPRLESQPAALRAIAGGWQLNGIYQAQTGFPFSVNYGGVLDIRYMTQRPDVTCDPNDGPKTTAQWFDTSCFVGRSLADSGVRPGNAGRNTVRGPGFQRTDMSIFKNFDFAGRHRIQARVEAFNLLNQARFSNPSGTFGTPAFGRSRPPRRPDHQLALKAPRSEPDPGPGHNGRRALRARRLLSASAECLHARIPAQSPETRAPASDAA
jgi:hypothetical protein